MISVLPREEADRMLLVLIIWYLLWRKRRQYIEWYRWVMTALLERQWRSIYTEKLTLAGQWLFLHLQGMVYVILEADMYRGQLDNIINRHITLYNVNTCNVLTSCYEPGISCVLGSSFVQRKKHWTLKLREICSFSNLSRLIASLHKLQLPCMECKQEDLGTSPA